MFGWRVTGIQPESITSGMKDIGPVLRMAERAGSHLSMMDSAFSTGAGKVIAGGAITTTTEIAAVTATTIGTTTVVRTTARSVVHISLPRDHSLTVVAR